MDLESHDHLLIRALALYSDVVADPMVHGPACAAVVAAAREALRGGHPQAAEALVAALRARAWFEHARHGNRQAMPLLDEATRLARRRGLDSRLRDVLLTRAAIHLELGHYEAARRDITAASEAGGGTLAELDLQQAALLYNAGYLDDAAALCRRVLGDLTTPVEVLAKVANNLAVIEVERGRPVDALRLLDQAAGLADRVGPAPSAVVASSRAWALARSGRLAEGIRAFGHAERLFSAAGLPIGELLLEQADAFVDLRLLPEARELADRAIVEFQTSGVALMAGDARFRSARIALLSGDDAGALELARDVAEDFRRQRRHGWAARAETLAVHAISRLGTPLASDLTTIRRAARVLDRLDLRGAAVEAHLVAGTVALARSHRRLAVEHFLSAQSLSRRGSVLVRLRGRLSAALAARTRSDDKVALQQSRAGLADLSRHRAALGSMELRALASGHGSELGEIGLGVLLRSGSATAVLSWMERTRAAALLTAAPPVAPTVRAHLAALSAVQAELEAARRAAQPETATLLTRQRALEGEVRRASWVAEDRGGDPSGRPTPVGVARRLLRGATLIAFGASDSRSFAVGLTGRRSWLVPLGPVEEIRHEADAALFALRRLVRPGSPRALAAARGSAEYGLERLRSLLLDPLQLDPGVPVVVLPDSVTRHVPWSSLHEGPVTVSPSLSLWARSVPTTDAERGPTVLVAGPGLGGAADEISRLAELYPTATVLSPPHSTVAAVTSALAGTDLAHLACHGMLRQDNPTFSALRLAHGDLSLHELDQMGRAPRRVVLASCESATGVGYDGDEVLGFVSALMARGTRGLIASLAPVGDLEAVDLNESIHRGLAEGATMAQALHAARGEKPPADERSFVNWCATTAFGAG